MARVFGYPWKRPDIFKDNNYRIFAEDNGVHADKFWSQQECKYPLNDDFKSLIEGLCAYNPTSRPTMADILGHPWMRGETLTDE